MRFIGVYDYTVWLTYLSLASAMVGLIQTGRGSLKLAVFCIMFSGFCDMFDGMVARTKKDRTQDEKNFGIQIDSLVDVIAFGVLPAAVFYACGVQSVLGIAVLVFYVTCGVSRLGFFNLLETKRQANPEESACLKTYRGMPITTSAMITPVVCAAAWLLPYPVRQWVYHLAPVVMGFLFILDVEIPKFNVAALFHRKKN